MVFSGVNTDLLHNQVAHFAQPRRLPSEGPAGRANFHLFFQHLLPSGSVGLDESW